MPNLENNALGSSLVEAIKQLFTPLAYLRIKHPQKYQFDILIPLVVALVVLIILMVLPRTVAIFGEKGLVTIITDLIQILVGFYIAALAAVATFQKEGLDSPLAGDSATLIVVRRGKKTEITLTRRKFICYLFGYLSFTGIVLYFAGSAADLLHENIKQLIPISYFFYVKWLFVFGYVFASSNLIITTLLGLHYLTDRLHRD